MTLNFNEHKVLKACKDAVVDLTGCEFGLTSHVKVRDLTTETVNGYLSILQSKDCISIWNSGKNSTN